jgi:HSP20 family protein
MLISRPRSYVSQYASFPQLERFAAAIAAADSRPERAFPALNVWEDEGNLYVESELPGYTLDKLEISTLGDELSIAGLGVVPEAENVAYLRQERWRGRPFKRSLRIGVPFESQNVQATLKNGVLTIRLPKATAAKARKIEVKGG